MRCSPNIVASSAPTHSTPGPIFRSKAGSGPIPNGNKLVTITKKNNAVSTSDLRRMASSKSRRTTANQAFISPGAFHREWAQLDGW